MTPEDLIRLRTAVGHSQQDAANLVHANGRTWRRWESGERAVDQASAHLYCLLVGVAYPWHAEEHLLDAG